MKVLMITCLAVFFSLNIPAQTIEDDFSDGDLSQWSGDVQDFEVDDGRLRLNAPMEGNSSVYAAFNITDTMIWELDFNMDFAPSNSNYLEVYLSSATDNFELSDAFFLRIGASGSDDKIDFYRRINQQDSLLASTAGGSMAEDPDVVVRMEKKGNTLMLQYRNQDELVFTDFFQGQADFGFLPEVVNFGLYCQYTSTRRNRFFFDNITVGTPQPDTVPPKIERFLIPAPDQLQMQFSEALDTNSFDRATIELTPSPPQVNRIEKSLSGPKGLNVLLSAPLTSEEEYLLSVEGLSDLAGNEILPFDTTFQVFYPDTGQAYDLIINEIMADPSPAIGLPEAEYIEVYNRSSKVLDLEGYSLSSGNSTSILPQKVMRPGEYAVITDEENAGLFPFVQHLVAVEGLIGLSNAGDDLLLSNAQGETIHFIEYNSSWYRDNERNDGGYSLEMINSNNPCLVAENWRASQSLAGGTPGFVNSIFSDSLVSSGPTLLSVFPISSDTLRVSFDRIPGSDINQLNRFSIDGLAIRELLPSTIDPKSFLLVLDSPLQRGTSYILKATAGVEDCSGAITNIPQQLPLQLPEELVAGDLVINEVLSDPVPGAEDYIELYNTSNKVLSLEGMAIRNDFNDQTVPLELEVLIFPGDYLVLTENVNGVLNNYDVVKEEWLHFSELPSFNNDEGNVQIGYIDLFGLEIIDEMNYRPQMHYTFLDDLEGISLEKLDPQLEGTDEDNWHSAAQSAGYGTPTGQNSQRINTERTNSSTIALSSDRISPDQDGFEDVLLINYNFDKPGYKADILIYSDRGQLIRQLGRDLLLSSNGQIKWDGLDDDGVVPSIGIYIIVIEALHPEGDSLQEKLPCVLAKRF